MRMANIEPASVLRGVSITESSVLLLDADGMFREVLVTDYKKWRFF